MAEKKINEKELKIIFENKIIPSHITFLKQYKVKLPKLYISGALTKDGITLGLLTKYIKQPITKTELTRIIRKWYPNTNDVQQPRHLGRQKGWYILSGTRGDILPEKMTLNNNEYCLITLEKPYPGYSGIDGHRSARGGINFQELKQKFDYRCATCGSKENEKNYLNKSKITKLQESHMNPNKSLTMENTIPQCDECNRAYRDWFIFDGNGRVIDINYNENSGRWIKKYKLK